MRVAVDFQNDRIEIDVPDDRLIAEWHGPAGATAAAGPLVRDAIERPRDFPPLRQAVVPGDRVVIAIDPDIPHPRAVLEAITDVLSAAGVEPGSTTVLSPGGAAAANAADMPPGVTLARHDPADRKQLAYLANTAQGRRIYLNRLLTDADFVLPVGRLGYDPVLGYRGPWSVLFPGLSDHESRQALRADPAGRVPDSDNPWPGLLEASEVSWLLGSQFQLGLLTGAAGLVEVVAGAEAVVRDQGMRATDRAWSFEPETRAELVVVGIGQPGRPTRIDDLTAGLATATNLVQRGGKIVALSRAEGDLGPAFRRLIGADDPRKGPAALRGHESDPDFVAAQQLARALAWADVYLFSKLGRDDVDDLSMIALDRPEEARRLVALCGSCLVVSHAELTRARVSSESD